MDKPLLIFSFCLLTLNGMKPQLFVDQNGVAVGILPQQQTISGAGGGPVGILPTQLLFSGGGGQGGSSVVGGQDGFGVVGGQSVSSVGGGQGGFGVGGGQGGFSVVGGQDGFGVVGGQSVSSVGGGQGGFSVGGGQGGFPVGGGQGGFGVVGGQGGSSVGGGQGGTSVGAGPGGFGGGGQGGVGQGSFNVGGGQGSFNGGGGQIGFNGGGPSGFNGGQGALNGGGQVGFNGGGQGGFNGGGQGGFNRGGQSGFNGGGQGGFNGGGGQVGFNGGGQGGFNGGQNGFNGGGGGGGQGGFNGAGGQGGFNGGQGSFNGGRGVGGGGGGQNIFKKGGGQGGFTTQQTGKTLFIPFQSIQQGGFSTRQPSQFRFIPFTTGFSTRQPSHFRFIPFTTGAGLSGASQAQNVQQGFGGQLSRGGFSTRQPSQFQFIPFTTGAGLSGASQAQNFQQGFGGQISQGAMSNPFLQIGSIQGTSQPAMFIPFSQVVAMQGTTQQGAGLSGASQAQNVQQGFGGQLSEGASTMVWPTITCPWETIDIPKKSPAGTEIANMSAVSNYNVIVTITDSDDQTRDHVYLDCQNGTMTQCTIKLKKPLEGNAGDELKLMFNASDTYTQSQQGSSCSVTVKITAVNLNAPRFQLSTSSYSVMVPETKLVGSDVSTVSATDDDGDQITYSINGVNTNFGNLKIDPITGAITVKKQFNCDQATKESYVITATDNGSPKRSNSAILTLTVIDVAEYPPSQQPTTKPPQTITKPPLPLLKHLQFNKKIYFAALDYLSSIGTYVIRTATSEDNARNDVRYNIEKYLTMSTNVRPDFCNGKFFINKRSGDIYTIKSFSEPVTCVLKIKATLGYRYGSFPSKPAYAHVIVSIAEKKKYW